VTITEAPPPPTADNRGPAAPDHRGAANYDGATANDDSAVESDRAVPDDPRPAVGPGAATATNRLPKGLTRNGSCSANQLGGWLFFDWFPRRPGSEHLGVPGHLVEVDPNL